MTEKYLLSIAISPVLITGLLLSQICAFNCAFNGCSTSAQATTQNAEQRAPCHQHKKSTTTPQNRDSHRCAGHFDALVLPSSGASAPQTQQGNSSTVVEIVLLFNAPVERVAPQSLRKPDRSPPPFSVLRI